MRPLPLRGLRCPWPLWDASEWITPGKRVSMCATTLRRCPRPSLWLVTLPSHFALPACAVTSAKLFVRQALENAGVNVEMTREISKKHEPQGKSTGTALHIITSQDNRSIAVTCAEANALIESKDVKRAPVRN